MSARDRLARADELIEEARNVTTPDPDDDPDEARLTRFELLLEALAVVGAAQAAAVIELVEERGIGVQAAPMPARPPLSETRPYAGG